MYHRGEATSRVALGDLVGPCFSSRRVCEKVAWAKVTGEVPSLSRTGYMYVARKTKLVKKHVLAL
jgi:hypothetical protein